MSHYLNNRATVAEIVLCQRSGRLSDKLGRTIITLCERLGSSRNFSGYSYRDEMVSEAIIQLTRGILNFDASRFDNAHAYMTMVARNAFLKVLKAYQRQADLGQALALNAGVDLNQNMPDLWNPTGFAADAPPPVRAGPGRPKKTAVEESV